MPDDSADDTADDTGIEEIEVVTTAVDEDGTVVVDDLKALVDEDGNILATDETIAVESPDGTVVIDEVISVADDDGELVAIEEDVVVIEERRATSSVWSCLSASRARSAWTFMRISLLTTSTTLRSWPITKVTRFGGLLAGDAHHPGDRAVGVGQQRVVEAVLLGELRAACRPCRS